MKLYRKLLIFYICLFANNRHSAAESRHLAAGAHTKRRKYGDSAANIPIRRKPPEPPPEPPPDRLKTRANDEISTIHLVRVNLLIKHSTDEYYYSFNAANKTHSFTAVDGYLFKSLGEGHKTLWRSENGKFSDKITVKELGNGERSIRVFVPIDEESSDSEIEESVERTRALASSDRPLAAPRPAAAPAPRHRKGAGAPPGGAQWDIRELKSPKKSQHPVKFVALDVRNRANTSKIYYERNELDGLDVFVPRQPYLFDRVTSGGRVIWQADGRELFGNEVIVRLDRRGRPSARINFTKLEPGGEFAPFDIHDRRHFHRGDPFVQTEPPKPESIFKRLYRKTISSESPGSEASEGASSRPLTVAAMKRRAALEDLRRQHEGRVSGHHRDARYRHHEHRQHESRGSRHHEGRVSHHHRDSGHRHHEHSHHREPQHRHAHPSSHLRSNRRELDYHSEDDDTSLESDQITVTDKHVSHGSSRSSRSSRSEQASASYESESESASASETEPDVRLIAIDVNKKQSNEYVSYRYDAATRTHSFTPRPPYAICRVTEGGRVKWTCRDAVCPVQVMVITDSRGNQAVRLRYPEGHVPLSDVPHEVGAARSPDPHRPPESHKPFDHIPISDRRPKQLDIGLTASNRYFRYSRHKNVAEFTARSHYLFNAVKESRGAPLLGRELVVWQTANPREFAHRVEYNFDSHQLAIFLVDGSKKKFKKIGGNWLDHTLIDPTRRVAIALDVQCKEGTYYFDYAASGGTEVYTPKSGYIFKLVKDFPLSAALGFDQVIWRTSDESEFSKRVELVDGRRLTIFSRNGLAHVYRRNAARQWVLASSFAWRGPRAPRRPSR